jgi:DNA topoisomerase-1
MEDDLDRIESSEAGSLEVLKRFYDPFKAKLDTADETMLSVKGVGIPTGLACPQCGKELHIKVGKNGHFLACSGYPECTYSNDYVRDEKGKIHPVENNTEEVSDKVCQKCGRPMVVKRGRYGEFLACSGYPECTHTESINSAGPGIPTGIACPREGCTGELVEKKSKRGTVFYGCNRFPDCTFALWDKPVDQPCPQCGAKILAEKTTKKKGAYLYCVTEGCDYKEQNN